MKITLKKEAFERINKLSNSETNRDSIVSELQLLKETLRKICNLNTLLCVGQEASNINILSKIFSDIFEDSSEIMKLITQHNVNNRFYSTYHSSFIRLYLAWELLSEDEMIKGLSDKNPYEYVIRIFERGFPLISVHNFKNSIRIGYEGDTFRVDVKEYTQEIPYIVSTEDAYLDAIDAYYLEYNKLPQWLEEDNKRGYVLT